jgi:acetyltransferase-like isoleucine patch superfamily enzyme
MKKIIVNSIEKLRRGEKSLSVRIKLRYKRKKFDKYATVGKNLNICSRADCTAEKNGLIEIGDNCRVYGTLKSMGDGKIKIGDHCAVYERSVIGSVDSITIGNCVIISNHVHIYDNNNHPTSPAVRHEMCLNGFEGEAWRWVHADSAPIVIEDDVWVGEYSAILKGVTVGRGSIVASHAVVTKDVPPYTIVAGNPARVVKELNNEK